MDKSYPLTSGPAATSNPGASPAGDVVINVSNDPLSPARMPVPVHHSAGDSPIVRTQAQYFCKMNPYDRNDSGMSPSPVTPQEASKG